MRAKLIDFSVGYDGNQRATFEVYEDFRPVFDELKPFDLELTVKKYRKKRSLDVNAYAWVLIDKLAAALNMAKKEVYRETISTIGGVSEIVCVRQDAAQSLIDHWSGNGIGWFAETMPSKINGCVNVTLYYGSSTYDTKQMSALIDALVQSCKALDIETLPPERLASLQALWNEEKEN